MYKAYTCLYHELEIFIPTPHRLIIFCYNISDRINTLERHLCIILSYSFVHRLIKIILHFESLKLEGRTLALI